MALYEVILEFNGRLPLTKNQIQRRHWSVGHKEQLYWRERVAEAFLETPRPGSPLLHAHLVLTRRSSRQPDYSGLVSGFFCVIDGLVANRIISDDNPGVISEEYEWETAPRGKPSIKVVVTEKTA